MEEEKRIKHREAVRKHRANNLEKTLEKGRQASQKWRDSLSEDEKIAVSKQRAPYQALHYLRNRDEIVDRRAKKKYGVSLSEARALLTLQLNKCAICIEYLEDVGRGAGVIDHCHLTGKFRGILCQPCNKALGFFRDDPDRLLRASQYLLGS